MKQGAQGWCTGMTLRDGMGREVGGALRVGNTLIHVNVRQTRHNIVISLQLKLINF